MINLGGRNVKICKKKSKVWKNEKCFCLVIASSVLPPVYFHQRKFCKTINCYFLHSFNWSEKICWLWMMLEHCGQSFKIVKSRERLRFWTLLSFENVSRGGGPVVSRVGYRLGDSGFVSCSLQTIFGRTTRSKICLVPSHWDTMPNLKKINTRGAQ